MSDRKPGARRLLIVANRSPFTAVEEGEELRFTESAGGLVSGLLAYLDSLGVDQKEIEYLWVGWPGDTISEKNHEKLKEVALKDYSSYPVFLSKDDMEQFYEGFCNKTIWPLFHYFPVYTRYDSDQWEVYKRVNEVFRDAVLEVIRPDDIVWVHDYQLMLLPQMIRDHVPDAQIGFFLHIPFPSFEIYRLLPREWGTQILQGLLGADLLGFHTYDYTQYFLRSVLRALGHEHSLGQMLIDGRVVKADTFPLGIDFDKFSNAARDPEVKQARENLKATLGDVKIILSIDRLDYSKGILNRLRGYEKFLEKNPHMHKRVTLALVVIPSRAGVQLYDETRGRIEGLVGRINGRFGRIDWTPIRYQYRSVPFQTLVTLYSASDIALVTPLRDGMNLIAKEYVAARDGYAGVLILSELAGAAKELVEAIIINPNGINEIADAIKEAIEMPMLEQARRNKAMKERLKRYDVVRWVQEFMRELDLTIERQVQFKARLLSDTVRQSILDEYHEAERRLLLLDYDGTLSSFAVDPQSVAPTDRVKELLRKLASDPRNHTYIVSGRDRETLQNWFGGMENIGMVAEHGAWVKVSGGEWKMPQALSSAWKASLRPVLETWMDRLPNSFIEEKEFSLAWHYRASDPEMAEMRASELLAYITGFASNIDIQVLQGHKVLEVKSSGVNKGTAARYIMARNKYGFILGIGDDWTDEYLFTALPEGATSIRVGMTQTAARYNLRDLGQVLELLESLVENSRSEVHR